MNILKSLILGAVLCVTAQAQFSGKTVSASAVPAGISTPVASAGVLQGVGFSTTSATGSLVYLYDGPPVVSMPAYTNVYRFNTNQVTTYITSTGLTNTFTNTVQMVSKQPIAANPATPIQPFLTVMVPPSGEVISFEADNIFSKSLFISNNIAGLSYTIFYRLP